MLRRLRGQLPGVGRAGFALVASAAARLVASVRRLPDTRRRDSLAQLRTFVAAVHEPAADGVSLSSAAMVALAVWGGIYLTIGERLIVPLGPGHAVPVANLLTSALVAALIIPHPARRRETAGRVLGAPLVFALLAVWSAFWAAAPILGFPVTTWYSLTLPLAIGAAVCTGAMVSASGLPVRGLWYMLVSVAWIQFVAGTMQALFYTKTLVTPPQTLLYVWDRYVSVAYGVEQIAGRSVGLYINPNTYTLLGSFLLIFAFTLPVERYRRALLAAPAAGIVLLGASRSAVVTLLLLAVPWLVRELRRLDLRQLVVRVGAVLVGLLAIHALLSAGLPSLYGRFAARWSTIPAIFTHGASGDRNVANRLSAWSLAFEHWVRHPLGSYGPSQYSVGSFTDNDYFLLLLQGGLVLLLAYLGTLATVSTHRKRSAVGASLGPLLGLLVITGMTQNSAIFTPSIALFWFAAGTALRPQPGTSRTPLSPSERMRRERIARARQQRVVSVVAAGCVAILLFAVGLRASGTVYAAGGRPVRPARSPEDSGTLPEVRVPREVEKLGGYFVDLPYSGDPSEDKWGSRSLSQRDRHDLASPVAAVTITVGGRTNYSPVDTAIRGLREYTRYASTKDERFALRARYAATWLVKNQRADGSWRYPNAVYDLPPGWASANMQGFAISLLAREYQDTRDRRYLQAARRAYEFMRRPVGGGWGTLSSFKGGDPVLEGYAGSKVMTHSLSGALTGLWGMHDLATVTHDPLVQGEARKLSDSLARHLQDYDIAGWSRYSLGELNDPSPDVYHRLFISELRATGQLTGDGRYLAQAARWEQSLQEWVHAYDPSLEARYRNSKRAP